ncbi:hypothetical protein J6590_059164 [Homalodisca vitripennis]|nr:hypothetical protein J6590_059164 [Homalodisca vitripennis]
MERLSILSDGRRRKKKSVRREQMSGKHRFRALVRMVLNHRPWLVELDRVGLGVDATIMKNVLMIDVITREKYQSLTLANKSLLRKDASLRTEEDIESLYKVIGNLKCFRRYPENVRKELVASTYFEYFGPDRVIVKQEHESTFLGFVLRGELEVTYTKMDPVFGKLVTEVTSHLFPGDVFGEVSLLHNVPRTDTVTSLSKCMRVLCCRPSFLQQNCRCRAAEEWVQRLSHDNRIKQRRAWMLLRWVTVDRSCPCKQPAWSSGTTPQGVRCTIIELNVACIPITQKALTGGLPVIDQTDPGCRDVPSSSVSLQTVRYT